MACNVLSGVPFLLFLRLTSSIANTANGRYAYFYVGCDLCLINCGFCLDNQPFFVVVVHSPFLNSTIFVVRSISHMHFCTLSMSMLLKMWANLSSLNGMVWRNTYCWHMFFSLLLLLLLFRWTQHICILSRFYSIFFFRFCIEKPFISHAVVSSWPAKRMLWKDCKCDVRCMLLMSSGLGCWQISVATDLMFYFSTCCEQICSSCDRNEYSIFINATIYHFTNAYDIEISRKVAIQHSVNWRWYYAEQKCT